MVVSVIQRECPRFVVQPERRRTVKKREGIISAVLSLVFIGTLLMAVSVIAGDKDKVVHPELSEQEMLVSCADCHKEATPEIEKEWYDSVHGIAMVKCYQCHGTFETFQVTPPQSNCETCHVAMADKKHTEDKPCWECHVPHLFKAKK